MTTKLIWRNARRSVQDYLIYIVTMILCVMLFYAFLSITSRYYQPDIGTTYDFTFLSGGVRMAVLLVALLLLFLIYTVNRYMLRRRQKEFAVQLLLGMEQRSVAWLFFAETLLMGALSVGMGIGLGVICSQWITAMLYTDYGQAYHFIWTLFPDTVLWTIGYFAICLCAVGLMNVRMIRKTKIIDMLSAQRHNDPVLQKSRWIPTICAVYLIFTLWMTITGAEKIYFYCDMRMPFPVQVMFWGNVIAPAAILLWFGLWLFVGRRKGISALLAGMLGLSALCAALAACVPGIQRKYSLNLGIGTINQYLLFMAMDLLFLICGIIYLASDILQGWKQRSPKHHYGGTNLFFLGEMTSKLSTTSKTMTMICITLTAAILMLLAVPVLTGWSQGYLAIRSMYDVQISSRYNNVYEENDLPGGNYDTITSFMTEKGIIAQSDLTFSLYLPRREDFHKRVKLDFPAAAVSLQDYNALRRMLGHPPITLDDGEFATQWQTIATPEERAEYLSTHTKLETDAGVLNLASQPAYTEPMGETIYNSYTDVLYILPDAVCQQLLPVMRNRYICTADPISFRSAQEMGKLFSNTYPEENADGPSYTIRMRTLQVNENKASNFILKTAMVYGAFVLMVICLTVLALQQLMDAEQYQARFLVLQRLGAEEGEIRKLILRLLGIWFGLPVSIAAVISMVVGGYFLQSISAEIRAYIGSDVLAAQCTTTVGILILLLGCYFICTYLLFQRSVEKT